MNRRRRTAANTSQLRQMWKGQGAEKQEKTVRHFNQHSASLKGKIKLDKETYIEYDYSKDYPVTKLHKSTTDDKVKKDNFEVPRYPTLKRIVSEMPKNSEEHKEMDLFLMREMNEALLWRNSEFEFH